jgi:hypothetical protein
MTTLLLLLAGFLFGWGMHRPIARTPWTSDNEDWKNR